ncbi:MAG: response regulator [Acidobacteriaceae bacterium]|nr:response regulator [Acidobacteriaceae bacterium]MBV9780555.1 response regulator [Acidobacteriaceae bacterium]
MRSAPSHRSPTPALILLVDDNQDGVVARRSVLEELGYKVISACCGRDALQAVEKEDVDLVITDYKMAPINGLEFIDTLRKRGFQKPIILLSGFAESLGFRSETSGADVVIQKSANEIAQLVRCTKRLLTVPKKPAGSRTVGKKGRGTAAS